uniref:Uncharacterized protein n=1 Tax=Cannabis sativa TaxID=3483 RepID=A0A803PBB5_CANSA
MLEQHFATINDKFDQLYVAAQPTLRSTPTANVEEFVDVEELTESHVVPSAVDSMDDSSVDPIGIIRDGCEALPRLNRSLPEVEEKHSARTETGDMRISPPLDRAIRSSCMYIEEEDASGVFVDRKLVLRVIVSGVNGGSPWESIHTPLKDRRRIFDRGRQWILNRRR